MRYAMRRGFSIIEMMVVLGILVLLTSLLVLYNRSGERQLLVLREKARLVGTVLRAKSLAVNTFVEDEPACGYGVHIEPPRYFIFRDRAIDCRTSDRLYAAASDEIVPGTDVSIPVGISFSAVGATDILFVPPDPLVFLNGGTAIETAVVSLQTADGATETGILITNAGQISEQ